MLASIRDAQIIVADEVLSNIDASEDRAWDASDFPCVAPPFYNMWIESKSSLTGITWGFWVLATDEKPFFDTRRFDPNYGTPKNTRWVLNVTPYVEGKNNDIHQLGVIGMLNVAPDGTWLDDNISMIMNIFLNPNMNQHVFQTSGKYFAEMAPVLLMTLALMNCKNVEFVDNVPNDKQSRRNKKKYGEPLTVFKTLRVKPSKRAATGDTEHKGAKNRAHMVRGHFKSYGPENPLFGKAVGTYYWGPLLRGTFSQGQVVKEYIVGDG